MREDRIRSDGQAVLGRRELVVSFGYTNVQMSFRLPSPVTLGHEARITEGLNVEEQK